MAGLLMAIRAALFALMAILPARPSDIRLGGLTFYYGAAFEGQPLYCGGTYSEDRGPWLALPIEWYKSGQVACGDWLLVGSPAWDQPYLGRALDAGHLGQYRIFDSGLPFVADLPAYWREGRPTATGWLILLKSPILTPAP